MRKMLPIALVLMGVGCSLPVRHNPNLLRKPAIPYVEEPPAPQALSEGSLWRDRTLVGDLRAAHVNDLVTIRIAESTNAISTADVSTKRAGTNSLNAPVLFGALAHFGIGTGGSGTRSTANTNQYAGNGTTGRSATFTTTVTARVVKVLNNETQRLYVAGMLDPHMLDSTNSISSGQVAELRIGYGGAGVVDETLKPGYISRLLNYIWPF